MIRLFVFYVSRTLFHQVQRFIRTWAFFLVLVLLTLGGAAGYAARWYYHRLSSLQEMLPEDFMEFFEAGSLSNLNALELGAGLLILGILIIQVVGAEKSVSRLFMQADVNLLFASPISAQKVLALRLLVGLGPGLFTGLFLFFSVPRLMHRFSLTPYGAAAIPGTWLLTLVFCFFLKMLIYEVGSRHAFFRRNLRWFVFGFLGVALVFFYFSYKGSEEQVLLLSAHRFWNAPVTRYLPIWGWLKAYLLFALEGKQQVSLLFLLLCLVVILLMAISSLRIPADYYEETLRGAEEMALLREDYLREGAPLLVGMLSHRRGAERSGGFHYGKGSTVYLWKVLFLRFRSARFFLLTKTSLTYLFTALAAGCFVRFFMDEPLEYVPALTLAAMVFFRTIVSPVTEDIRKASFRLMPSSIWSKTFFSALGGSLGCALDAALPLMAGSLAAGFSPFSGLVYVPVLAGVDFFASTAGAFVDVSLPEAIGVVFKQVMQILLLYVGLLFDGMLLVSGIAGGHVLPAFYVVTLINLVLGLFFLGLTGVWLSPSGGRKARDPSFVVDEKGARKAYGQVGLVLFAMLVLIWGGRFVLGKCAPSLPLLSLYLPIYGLAYPLGLWLLRRGGDKVREAKGERGSGESRSEEGKSGEDRSREGKEREENRRERETRGEKSREGKWKRGELLLLFPMSCFLMYSGNMLGMLLGWILGRLLPFSFSASSYAASAERHIYLQVFLLAVAAPVMEELLFRRAVLGRLLPYGERAALVASALFFALFHTSVAQVCYAFLLGLCFGYAYLRTGKIWAGLCLHLFVNSLSTVILPLALLPMGDLFRRGRMGDSILQEPGVLPLLLFVAFLMVMFLWGAVVFFYFLREKELCPDGVSLRRALSYPGAFIFLAGSLLWLLVGLPMGG